jgi:hypothetical protein
MTDIPPPLPVTTQELRVVDAQGRPRIVMSAKDGVPTITLLRDDGEAGASLALDAGGRPAVRLANPVIGAPVASFEIDDKGAHVKFDGPDASSSYLFLNNAGVSGIVLIDRGGKRRLQATVGANGVSHIERLDDQGNALP